MTIEEHDKERFESDTNQKKMILVHEKVKARRPRDWPGMDFQEACLAKHRFVGKIFGYVGVKNNVILVNLKQCKL